MREEVVLVMPVVNVIVVEQDRILMIQEAKESCLGLWHLPAGGVNRGESLLLATQREVLEESGIEVEAKGIFEVHRNVQDPHELWRFVMVADVVGGRLKKDPDAESLQADWFFVEELPELNLRNALVFDLIKRYFANPHLLPPEHYHHFI